MAPATIRRTAVPQFEIWKVGDRIHSVDNPVRLEILAALEAKPRTLNDLVDLTGKAKSTLSAVHLQDLIQNGLVQEAIDPHDARVKWYKPAGHRLGASNVEKARLRDAVLEFVRGSGLIPLAPLLDVVQPKELVERAPPDYADALARRLGRLVAKMVMATDAKDASRDVSQILEAAGLGKTEWSGAEPRLPARATGLQRFSKTTAEEAMRAWRERAR